MPEAGIAVPLMPDFLLLQQRLQPGHIPAGDNIFVARRQGKQAQLTIDRGGLFQLCGNAKVRHGFRGNAAEDAEPGKLVQMPHAACR